MLVEFTMGGTFRTFESDRLEEPYLNTSGLALIFKYFFLEFFDFLLRLWMFSTC